MSEALDAFVKQMYQREILYREAVKEFQKVFVASALREYKGNLSKAAPKLGIHAKGGNGSLGVAVVFLFVFVVVIFFFAVAVVFLFVFFLVWLSSKEKIGSYRAIRRV